MSVDILAPPGDVLHNYIHEKRHDEQPEEIPEIFRDAMAVREEVFVDEQACSLVNEVDDDDARSWHWVVYVSVANNRKNSSTNNVGHASERKDSADASATRKPVGTLRLVPPPHGKHPHDGDFQPTPAYHEPYVKLTRLALSKDYRGKYGLSRLLLSEALNYAINNAAQIYRAPSPARLEQIKLEGDANGLEEGWKGLVLVHAQKQLKTFWEKTGFTHDEGLGEWDEEGIRHIGMWRRIPLKE
ncbi:hypothetical protein EJ05DRAFT_477159 [Pseudovirgaria hyperparasitica]|uniref:N-acetyltransferase domain-containing protein n=1 Tax=Pseudovirgaria hyperparasitica TaxID=470096 RepID=A0A6A6W435_9PEZI|nr:uncharacterized protein EJ05DRAFT_477159 [Pseudovirgaria hyperparasitica]KAF2756929.1 hypothetical protein EJ05DRAFT_477159 [Pseudovirgaria hyperparasitica]